MRSIVGNSIAEKVEGWEFFDAADGGADEDGSLAGIIRNSDFDRGVFVVAPAAAEAETAFGNIVAFDDVLASRTEANAGNEMDACANVAAQINFAVRSEFWERSGARAYRRFFDRSGGCAGRYDKVAGWNEFIDSDGSTGICRFRSAGR